jgi:hypothetical protein
MRLRLKAVNDELAKRGYGARLVKGGGYSIFSLARPRLAGQDRQRANR